ncbi:MAG: dienelactone hydrolase, partial [Lacticaseibacillus paracasei]|nr:dienelactone hydrolase [Lacticaseibacillus paracasei]
MAFEFKLPELGEGLAEGEIVKWDVKPGDDIKEDDTLLEVQSDKSVEEIPSPVSGKILKILVPEGETASVGDLLVEIDDGSGPAAAPATATAAPATPAPATPAVQPAPAQSVYQFKLPELGEGLAEGEIVKWSVKPGDQIKEDDTLLEVQSDKSVEEIPSPVAGTVVKILVPEGETATVGEALVDIDAPGHNDTSVATEAGAAPQPVAATPAAGGVPAITDPNREILAMPSVRQ